MIISFRPLILPLRRHARHHEKNRSTRTTTTLKPSCRRWNWLSRVSSTWTPVPLPQQTTCLNKPPLAACREVNLSVTYQCSRPMHRPNRRQHCRCFTLTANTVTVFNPMEKRQLRTLYVAGLRARISGSHNLSTPLQAKKWEHLSVCRQQNSPVPILINLLQESSDTSKLVLSILCTHPYSSTVRIETFNFRREGGGSGLDKHTTFLII